MAPSEPTANAGVDVTALAIRVLIDRGYESTSVEELADSLGISRSTFFRRFGTKEDIVFADHSYLVDRLSDVMLDTDGDAFESVNAGCLLVIRYHLSRPEATLERRALMRSNPSLRERELVMSHRYERAFRMHLSSAFADSVSRSWLPSAYAAAAVAVHNDALRAWFADPRLDAVAFLQAQLASLAESFRQNSGSQTGVRSRVVVATFSHDAPIDQVMDDIRRTLSRPAL